MPWERKNCHLTKKEEERKDTLTHTHTQRSKAKEALKWTAQKKWKNTRRSPSIILVKIRHTLKKMSSQKIQKSMPMPIKTNFRSRLLGIIMRVNKKNSIIRKLISMLFFPVSAWLPICFLLHTIVNELKKQHTEDGFGKNRSAVIFIGIMGLSQKWNTFPRSNFDLNELTQKCVYLNASGCFRMQWKWMRFCCYW